MSNEVRKVVLEIIRGSNSHVDPLIALEGLTAAQARKRVHKDVATIWEQLAHTVYWQDVFLTRIGGNTPKMPKTDAESWPKTPPVAGQAASWEKLVKKFDDGLKELAKAADRPDLEIPMSQETKRTYLDQLLSAGQHMSYHLGQIVTVRRLLGLWPPPSGGITW